MDNNIDACNACSGSGPEPPKAAVRLAGAKAVRSGKAKRMAGGDDEFIVESGGGMCGGNIAVVVVSVLLIVVVICIIVMCTCRKPSEDTYRVTRPAVAGAASDVSSVVTVSGPGFGGGSWRSRGGSSVDFSYGK